MPEEKKVEDKQIEEEKKIDEKDFFVDLLNPEDDEDETDDDEQKKKAAEEAKAKDEEEQRRKNKDAEEARKRREAEAKAKAEADAKAAEEASRKQTSKETPNENVNKLGEQLVEFKKKYPDVELVELDKDANFKKYIEGKLLGRKDFTGLYEEYVELRQSLSGKSQEEIRQSYERKAAASSGSSKTTTSDTPDVYSEEELEKISKKLPYMSRAEADRVSAKLDKSIAFYENKK